MVNYLTGAGHFGVGFLVGTLMMLLVILFKKRWLFGQLYAPFLPFLLGGIAILPHFVYAKKMCDFPVYVNVFLFYPSVHCNNSVASILNNLHVVAIVCGTIYCLIIWRYIGLVKRVRRHGWYK